MRPTIGCFIPTPGRKSLIRTLNSVAMQGLEGGDDILVVGDGFNQGAQDLVNFFGSPFRYVATNPTRDWGHSQCNYGLKHIKGDWIIGQDDDDVFLPRAFDEIRRIADRMEPDDLRPIIGRVMTPFLGILWKEVNAEPLDGHCLVLPNVKKKLGYFGLEYAGDQKYITSSLDPYEKFSWADRIWALTRPTQKLWPRLTQAKNSDTWCAWNFHRDEGGLWATDILIQMGMTRPTNDSDWEATMSILGPATLDEIEEVVQFAAWAAQGVDVFFGPNKKIEPALIRSGYVPHQFDYKFKWPPHKFEPAEDLT